MTSSQAEFKAKIDCLPKRTTVQEIKKLFGGIVTQNLEVIFEHSSNKRFKSAIISASDSDEFQSLLDSSKKIHGRHLACEPLKSKGKSNTSFKSKHSLMKIYLKRIPSNMPDEELK